MTTSADQTILSASSFVGSIGVNTHVGYSWGSYDNLALLQDSLEYLGVTKLRDGLTNIPEAQPVLNGLAADGYKFDLVVPSGVPAGGSAALQQYLATVEQFSTAHAGSVIALEGLNEANLQAFSYNGSSTIEAAAQFQAAYFSAVNGNAALANIAVYNLSLGYNDTTDYAKLGDLSGASDYANSHAYVSTSTTPQATLALMLANAKSVSSGNPAVITETGYTTQSDTPYIGASENVQAKSILNTLVDAFKGGVGTTYLYQLLDAGASGVSNDPEMHFGLFNSDGAPKLAATAVHNLTTILSDDGTGGHQPTAQLGYSLSNMPDTGNSMVLGKSNGAYELVIWAEPKVWNDATDTEISNPSQPVTVNLGGVHHTVSVYDPLSGTTPIATYTDVSQITVPLSDHPLIIEIDAPLSPAPEEPLPTDVSGTAAEIALQLSDLNTNESLQTITLTDTHVLPVASESTMKYMISHYGNALSAIQGGYSFSVTTSTSAWSVTKVFDSSANLQSTTTSNFLGGFITSKSTVFADGSTDSTLYTAGVATQQVTVDAASGSRETKSFDPVNGKLTADLVQHTDGSSSNTLYSAGVKTKMYVTNADHSHDNSYYNITGQNYTTQTQHYSPTGQLTSDSRWHADGSLAYTQVITSDGSSKLTTLYDATGHKTTVIAWTSAATTTSKYDLSGNLVQEIVHTVTGDVTTSNYKGSVLSSVYIASSNGTKEAKIYDSAGRLASDLIQKTDGSSSNTLYSANVKTKMYVTNADGSHDNTYYNITGQSYTTQKQHYDSKGVLTADTRWHADGTLAYTKVISSDGSSKVTTLYDAAGHKATVTSWNSTATTIDKYDSSGNLVQEIVQTATGNVTTSNYNGSVLSSVYIVNANGSKETKIYDSAGRLSSDLVQNKDGSSSNTLFSAGVKTKMYVSNADGSDDNTYYNITGQSYTTRSQHYDSKGVMTAETRWHADGSLDYHQDVSSDASSKVTALYDATGHKTTVVRWNSAATRTEKYDTSGNLIQEVVKTAAGNVTTSNYNGSELSSVYIVNANGSKETKIYDSAGRLASDLVQNNDGSSSNTLFSAGIKTKMYVTNADGSNDNTYYNITGQAYTTRAQHYDAAGKMTADTRWHADGTLEYRQVISGDGTKVTDLYDSTGHKLTEITHHTDGSTVTDSYNASSGALVQDVVKTAGGDVTTTNYSGGVIASIYVANADGFKESKLFDSAGNLTSDYVQNTDGSSSNTLYSSGVKMKMYVSNADGSDDNYYYNITGQTYTTQIQHVDAAGKITSDTRLHADGSLDYKQVINSDGSKVTDLYDSTGSKTQEIVNNADGTKDVYKYVVSGNPGATQHESYTAGGTLLQIDVQNNNGTHTVTAVSTGQSIQGGNGNDLFSAAPGSTTIVFDHGNDQINSFQAGAAANHDMIKIAASLVADYSHLQFTQSGADTLIHLSATDSITLKNVYATNLDHSNFLFV
ncbi:RHS repeat protein [Bradyrhizobium sp. AUGA SZCCT0182]|uniref:RHS repeat protein n=1 Tax=Bradyrhizobium sp. AUGA SZCCT0182 TaxID=2807667 RepID=UPI001BAD8F4C|nr:RHS repeat protein [Bradyrhizobium sp. AUGA SZCCT0182]MBR1234844.1 RHS repeat protein [Bradyrhizobium sp. AUGA SZCCT0182]